MGKSPLIGLMAITFASMAALSQENLVSDDGKSPKPPLRFTGHRGSIQSLSFSGDGSRIASVAADGTARIWDVASKKEVRCIECKWAQVYPGGRLLVATDQPREKALLLDIGTEKRLRVWEVSVHGELSPNGQDAVGDGEENGDLCLYDADAFKLRSVLRRGAGSGLEWPREIDHIAFSADGRIVAAGGRGCIPVVEVPSGKELWIRSDPSRDLRVMGLAFSPDGGTLAAIGMIPEVDPVRIQQENSSRDRQFRKPESWSAMLWDARSGWEVSKFTTKDRPTAFAFSPDGQLLAIADGRKIGIWESISGQRLRETDEETSAITALAISPDGMRLAVGTKDGLISLCRLPAEDWQENKANIESSSKEIHQLWELLATHDPAAYQATWQLGHQPNVTVRFLKEHLKVISFGERAISQLIDDLDDKHFEVRDRAYRGLARLGSRASVMVRAAARKSAALDTRVKIEQLLQELEEFPVCPEELRNVRAVHVLKHIATPEAKTLLREISNGPANALATQAARFALTSLENAHEKEAP